MKLNKRALLVMGIFFYSTIGVYLVGRYGPKTIKASNPDIGFHWMNGFLVSLLGGILIFCLVGGTWALISWINEEK